MSVLLGEQITDSQSLLLDVFRDGYADRYVGDQRFLEGYLLRAHVAVVDDRDEVLRGAALLRNSRITSIATRTDREKYGSRFQGLVGLLHMTHEVDDDAWIGIGSDVKPAMRAAADQAGMSRTKDEELLRVRLVRSGKIDQYSVRSNAAGLVISLAGSNHGADYWQEVWDWSTATT